MAFLTMVSNMKHIIECMKVQRITVVSCLTKIYEVQISKAAQWEINFTARLFYLHFNYLTLHMKPNFS